MKKTIFLLLGIALLFSGCAIHHGLTANANLNTTEVVLAKKNFKVIESVQGKSQAMYILGIGGLSKKALLAEARANMLANANIIGDSRAIINESVELKHSFFPFVRKHQVTVTAHIIEFTE